jgi:intracellular sulfur oxidation DsrE/DsrF family protein
MDVSLVLVGEALMRAQDPRQAIKELLGPQVLACSHSVMALSYAELQFVLGVQIAKVQVQSV